VRLLTFPGRPDLGMPWGSSVEPGCDAWATCGHQYRFTAVQQQEGAVARDVHQVLVHTGAPAPVILALMRHELEHVRQHHQSLWITRASTALNRSVEVLTEDLPGAFWGVYPLLPAEQDASAAGSRLAHSRCDPLDVLASGAEHGSLLFTERSSGLIEELPARLIGLAALFPFLFGDAVRELFAQQADPHVAAGLLVEELLPPVGRELYAACMLDGEIARVRDGAPELIGEAWARISVIGPTAWVPVAQALAAVERRAEALARS
jgi:hypothetical protein